MLAAGQPLLERGLAFPSPPPITLVLPGEVRNLKRMLTKCP